MCHYQAGGLTGGTANLAVNDSHAGRARCGITADWLSRASRISANFAASTAADIARGALSAWADKSDQSALAISATIEASTGTKNGPTIRLPAGSSSSPAATPRREASAHQSARATQGVNPVSQTNQDPQLV